jgi:hypothetical protein
MICSTDLMNQRSARQASPSSQAWFLDSHVLSHHDHLHPEALGLGLLSG